MPPVLAAFLTFSFVCVLFFRESKKHRHSSPALWIPVLWIFVTSTRTLTQWLNLGQGGGIDEVAMHGGTLIDAAYFLALILAGLVILTERRLRLGHLMKNNKWVCLLLIYGFLAILWSDYPFISFKRWVKILGHPLMALIILTDPKPDTALRIVFKRCAFLSMPLSILFIKYFPEYGRGFDRWTGEAFNNGATLNKNELGYGCMIFGIFFVWHLFTVRALTDRKHQREEFALGFTFIIIIGWLLYKAGSATSLVAFLVGTATLVALSFRSVSKRFLAVVFLLTGVIVFLQVTLDIYAVMLSILGRDPTLTDRTHLWADAIHLVQNPLIGAGFESFWLGERVELLWSKWWWRPIQAHNGYIEVFLNLGIVGLVLLLGALWATFTKATNQIKTNSDFARLRLSYLIAIMFYNCTEATFVGVHLVWTVFFLVALDYPIAAGRRGRGHAHRDASIRLRAS